MKDIPDKSIDMILCDLPYGTTACKWDTIIPFEPLWKQYERISKDNASIILFAKQPFASQLIISNLKYFRYEIIWDKNTSTDFAQSNRKPLNVHENIEVFYKKPPKYHRIDDEGFKPYSDNRIKKLSSELGAKGCVDREPVKDKTTRCPTTIRRYFPDNKKGKGCNFHPTQKPIDLLEWLIKSYSNEGNVVLDNCMGSGSTGVAALNLHRKFIGMELDEKYFQIAEKRIQDIVQTI
ncbi:MAG: site-specific DNA-methyltransferase [Bacilli bacterium]|nr:site-specific DNA-methyltransferase [Bacilli bacterium]